MPDLMDAINDARRLTLSAAGWVRLPGAAETWEHVGEFGRFSLDSAYEREVKRAAVIRDAQPKE